MHACSAWMHVAISHGEQPTHVHPVVRPWSMRAALRALWAAWRWLAAGKTYTMLGSRDAPGMIPRAMHQIFDTSIKLGTQGWSFNMQASLQQRTAAWQGWSLRGEGGGGCSAERPSSFDGSARSAWLQPE